MNSFAKPHPAVTGVLTDVAMIYASDVASNITAKKLQQY